MIDPKPLWDFDDPAASEARFREAATTASDRDDEQVLLTQAARALGLQERYAEGHALLDGLASSTAEVRVRVALERGRLLRSAGSPDDARSLFEDAAMQAASDGLDNLRVDALHMVALVADQTDQLAINEQGLAIARASADQRARDWDASLLNNIGMTHADAEDLPAALASFEAALAARERIGDPGRTRVARWMIAWTLRRMGRTDEARTMQLALKAELDAAGEADPYVDEELALLTES
jgi:tetratricopeptide (TPR) repeat protein